MEQIIKFGTDGWRGKIAEDFTFENVKTVAQAIADYFREYFSSKTRIVIGYDTRFLSDKYAFIVAGILAANRLDVLLSKEAIPSPVISYAVIKEKAQGAVMITASHNPSDYNGIKIKTFYGGPADKNITKNIERHLYKSRVLLPDNKKVSPVRELSPLTNKDGGFISPLNSNNLYYRQKSVAFSNGVKLKDFKKEYIKNIKTYIDVYSIKKARFKVIIDTMFGVGQNYLEEILENSLCKIISINKKIDPLFGGLQPEPIEVNLSELKQRVKNEKADIGLATDGDADRIAVVDEKGRYLTPHQVFPMLLLYLIEEKKWRGSVIQAISLGYLGKRIAKYYNLPFQEVAVGFKNVSELMYRATSKGEYEVLMGGEESGGYGYKGYIPERDGILSSLLLLEMLANKRQKLSEVLTKLEKKFGKSYYERADVQILNTKVSKIDKHIFVHSIIRKLPKKLINIPVRELKTFDGIKIFLEDDSWLLIRPSGTEPILRIYAETDSKQKVKELINTGKELANC